MKTLHTLSLFILLASSASLLLACAGSATPTTIPATTAPTAIQATVPPTPAPTATSAPTDTPTAVTSDADADKTVRGALAKFQTAKAFRLDAHAELSPIFFQGPYTPAPGEDPNKVTLFSIKGEQNGADLHYALNGFMASFIGLLSGFDPNSQALEIAQVNGTQYMRGKLENETQARWYSIPANQAASTRFAPQDLIAPMVKTTYPDGAFSKTGSETLGKQTCNVFTGNRAAFDAVFPGIGKVALLSTETLDLSTIDRAEYKIWVCADGNVYRTQYNFDAHAKTQADKKGSFAFTVNVADYDADISIQAPAGAAPLSGSPSNTGPTTEPTKSSGETGKTTFTSLEGEWEGTSDTDSPISFTVTKNEITFANLNYSINTGGCSVGGAYGTSVDNGAIKDQSFSFVLTNSDDVRFIFTGKFNSNYDASGMLQIKGKTFCGDTDNQATWTAKHLSSPDTQDQNVEPTDEPTAEPTE
jgi:hypothetical protein